MPRLKFGWLGLVTAVAVGCGADDMITTYEIPRPVEYRPPAADRNEYRTLGAMFPAEDPVWFFKFSDRADVVARYEAEFDRLICTVRLRWHVDGTPQLPSFEAPADWVRTGRRVVRRGGIALPIEETLRFGPADDPHEITITQSGGGVAQNLARWADQVGYRYLKTDDLLKATRRIEAVNVQGLRVDVAGPKNPSAPRRPIAGMGQ